MASGAQGRGSAVALAGLLLAACAGGGGAVEVVAKDVDPMADMQLADPTSPDPTRAPEPAGQSGGEPSAGGQAGPAATGSGSARITGEDGVAVLHAQMLQAVGAAGPAIAPAVAALGRFPAELALPEDAVLLGVNLSETNDAVQLDDDQPAGRSVRNVAEVSTRIPMTDVPAFAEALLAPAGFSLSSSGWSTSTSGEGEQSTDGFFVPDDADARSDQGMFVYASRAVGAERTVLDIGFIDGLEGEEMAEPVSLALAGLTPFADMPVESAMAATYYFSSAATSFDLTFKSPLDPTELTPVVLDRLSGAEGLLQAAPDQSPTTVEEFTSITTTYPGTDRSSVYVADSVRGSRVGVSLSVPFTPPEAVTAITGVG